MYPTTCASRIGRGTVCKLSAERRSQHRNREVLAWLFFRDRYAWPGSASPMNQALIALRAVCQGAGDHPPWNAMEACESGDGDGPARNPPGHQRG